MTRKDLSTNYERNITVWPDNPMGYSSEDIKVRFQWTYPIVFSRHTPNVVYAAGNYLYRSTNEGESWTRVSPDLSRHDPKTMGASGGPLTKDQTGVETYALIFAFDEVAAHGRDCLWAGTDDGYIWVVARQRRELDERHAERHWRLHRASRSSSRRTTRPAARTSRRTATSSATSARFSTRRQNAAELDEDRERHQGDRSSRASSARIPARRGLLFAGTERGVWVSFDDGGRWQSLQRNLPPAPVHDMTIKEGDLIAATHARGFYVMDDRPRFGSSRRRSSRRVHTCTSRVMPIESTGAEASVAAGRRWSRRREPAVGRDDLLHARQGEPGGHARLPRRAGRAHPSFTSNPDSLTCADSLRGDQRKAARATA
jgi:hypothetical protein